MKSKKRTEQEVEEFLAEIGTVEKLPFDLVGATALHFLRDESQCSDSDSQQRAINSAITFLKLCAQTIETRRVQDLGASYVASKVESHGWKLNDTVPYRAGIKFITGEKRFDRAQQHYEAFRKDNCLLSKPLAAPELTAALKEDEQEGFLAQSLPPWRHIFKISREGGLIGRKRRTKIQNAA